MEDNETDIGICIESVVDLVVFIILLVLANQIGKPETSLVTTTAFIIGTAWMVHQLGLYCFGEIVDDESDLL